MPRLRISVITPSYNQGRFLERTLRSVLDQEGEFDLEYLVIEGGSTDESIDILGRQTDGRLRWTSEHTGGQVEAVNSGLRRATGEVVGWLNSDDVLLPGALARVADAFTRDPSLGWVHGRCDIIDEHDRMIRRFISSYKDWRCQNYSYKRLIVENFISQMTVFWRRSLMDRVGYIDTGLAFSFDYDLWLRFAALGAPHYIPQRQACFRWYATSKSGSGFRRQLAENFAVARRQTPGLYPLHLVKLGASVRIYVVYEVLALARTFWRGCPGWKVSC